MNKIIVDEPAQAARPVLLFGIDSGTITTMKHLIALLLFSFLLVSAATAQQPATIFFVRHAEKATTGGDDMDISETGRARAESLATVLKDAGISAIYTTELKRTQQTAAPLAKALGIAPDVIPVKDQLTLLTKLKGSSSNVLVVGHGNTIPDLIKAFGITTPISIADNDYDNLFIVLLEATPRLIRLHYR